MAKVEGLTEVLIALFLSSLIFIGLIKQFIVIKHHYIEVSHRVSQDTDTIYIIDDLRDSIRHAGFTPCMNVRYLQTDNTLNHHAPVSGIDINNNSVVLRRMDDDFVRVLEVLSQNELIVPPGVFKPGHVILVADCYAAEVHEIVEVVPYIGKERIRLKHKLCFDYISRPYIGIWKQESYDLKATKKGPVLFYTHQHTDALATNLQTFDITRIDEKNNTIVDITLGTINGTNKNIRTRIRS
jgi:hypothetical protein